MVAARGLSEEEIVFDTQLACARFSFRLSAVRFSYMSKCYTMNSCGIPVAFRPQPPPLLAPARAEKTQASSVCHACMREREGRGKSRTAKTKASPTPAEHCRRARRDHPNQRAYAAAHANPSMHGGQITNYELRVGCATAEPEVNRAPNEVAHIIRQPLSKLPAHLDVCTT